MQQVGCGDEGHVLCRDAAQAHCEGASRELAEREAHLEEQLQGARAEASALAEAQVAAASQAQERLEGHLAVLRATAADWQVQPCVQPRQVSRAASRRPSQVAGPGCAERLPSHQLPPVAHSSSCSPLQHLGCDILCWRHGLLAPGRQPSDL